jgi:hypothetical protein
MRPWSVVIRRLAQRAYSGSLGLIVDLWSGRPRLRRGDAFLGRAASLAGRKARAASGNTVDLLGGLREAGGWPRVRAEGWSLIGLQGLVMVAAAWWALRLRDFGYVWLSRVLGFALVLVAVGWLTVSASGYMLGERLGRQDARLRGV